LFEIETNNELFSGTSTNNTDSTQKETVEMSTGTSPSTKSDLNVLTIPIHTTTTYAQLKVTAQRNGRDGGRALSREKGKAIIPSAPNFETVTRRRIGTGTYGISDF
jgi:hypothetical protein